MLQLSSSNEFLKWKSFPSSIAQMLQLKWVNGIWEFIWSNLNLSFKILHLENTRKTSIIEIVKVGVKRRIIQEEELRTQQILMVKAVEEVEVAEAVEVVGGGDKALIVWKISTQEEAVVKMFNKRTHLQIVK